MTLDEILRVHKCGVQGCKSGPYCLAIGNMHYNMSRLDIEFWMSLVETEFNADNPPLKVVERVIANSVRKANSEGGKKKKKEEAPEELGTPTAHPYFTSNNMMGTPFSMLPPY